MDLVEVGRNQVLVALTIVAIALVVPAGCNEKTHDGEGTTTSEQRSSAVGSSCRGDDVCPITLSCVHSKCIVPTADIAKAHLDRKEFEDAVSIGSRACNNKDGNACALLARMYHRGRGVMKNDVKGDAFFEKACAAGVMDSCLMFGASVIGSQEPGRNVAAALAALEKACAGNLAQGCNLLGTVLFKGRVELPAEPKRALTLIERACGLGLAKACISAAAEYFKGERIARDPAKAASLALKACNLGNGNGCFRYSLHLYKGDGVAKDLSGCIDYLTKACDAGNQDGCRLMTQMACDAGSRDACRKVRGR